MGYKVTMWQGYNSNLKMWHPKKVPQSMFQSHCVTSAECMYVQLAPLSTADQHELREKERMRLASDVTELVCFELAAVCSLLLYYIRVYAYWLYIHPLVEYLC